MRNPPDANIHAFGYPHLREDVDRSEGDAVITSFPRVGHGIKRLGCLVAALIVWSLAFVAGRTAYSGIVTGCVQAKYGLHCQATAPILFAVTIAITCFSCCCSIGIGTLFAAFVWRRER